MLLWYAAWYVLWVHGSEVQCVTVSLCQSKIIQNACKYCWDLGIITSLGQTQNYFLLWLNVPEFPVNYADKLPVVVSGNADALRQCRKHTGRIETQIGYSWLESLVLNFTHHHRLLNRSRTVIGNCPRCRCRWTIWTRSWRWRRRRTTTSCRPSKCCRTNTASQPARWGTRLLDGYSDWKTKRKKEGVYGWLLMAGSTPGRDTVKDRVLVSQLLCRLISACLDVVHIACAKFSVHGEDPLSTFW